MTDIILSAVDANCNSSEPSIEDGLTNSNSSLTIANDGMGNDELKSCQISIPDETPPDDDYDEVYGDNGPSDDELEAQAMESPSAGVNDAMKKAIMKLPEYEKKWGLLGDNGKLKMGSNYKLLTFGLEREFTKLPDSMNLDVNNAITLIRQRDSVLAADEALKNAYNTIVEHRACVEASKYLSDEAVYYLIMSQQRSPEGPEIFKPEEQTAPWYFSTYHSEPHLTERILAEYDNGFYVQIYHGINIRSQSTIEMYVAKASVQDYRERHGRIDLKDAISIDLLKETILLSLEYSYQYAGSRQKLPLNSRTRKHTLYNCDTPFRRPSQLSSTAVAAILNGSGAICSVEFAPGVICPAIHHIDPDDKRNYGTYTPIFGGLSYYAESGAAKEASQLIFSIEPKISQSDFTKISTALTIQGAKLHHCTKYNLIPFEDRLYNSETKETTAWSDIVEGRNEELKDICFFYKLAMQYCEDEPPLPKGFVNLDGTPWEPVQSIDSLFDSEEERHAMKDFLAYCLHPYSADGGFMAFFVDGSGDDESNIGLHGSNGKSLVLRLIKAFYGDNPDNPESSVGDSAIGTASLYDFGDRFGLSNCITSYIICSDENDEGKSLPDTHKVKSIATGEQITIEVKFHTPVSIKMNALVIELFNKLPPLGATSGSFDRRLLIFRFNKDFRGKAENKRISHEYIYSQETLNWFGWYLTHVIGIHDFKRDPSYFTREYEFLRKNLQYYKSNTDVVTEFCDDLLWPKDDNELYPYHLRSEVWLPRQLYAIFKPWYQYKYNTETRMSEPEFKQRLAKCIESSDDWSWYHGDNLRWSAKKWLFGIYEPAIRKFQVVELMQCSSFHGNMRDYQALTPLMQINLADTSGQHPLNGKGTYSGKNFIFKVKDDTDKKALEDSIIEIRKDYDQLDSATGQLAPQPATGLDYNGAWNDIRFHAMAIRTDELLKHFTPEQLEQMAEAGQVLLTPPVPYAEMPIIANSTTIKAALALHKEKTSPETRTVA